jgi:hypothetical protein
VFVFLGRRLRELSVLTRRVLTLYVSVGRWRCDAMELATLGEEMLERTGDLMMF